MVGLFILFATAGCSSLLHPTMHKWLELCESKQYRGSFRENRKDWGNGSPRSSSILLLRIWTFCVFVCIFASE